MKCLLFNQTSLLFNQNCGDESHLEIKTDHNYYNYYHY